MYSSLNTQVFKVARIDIDYIIVSSYVGFDCSVHTYRSAGVSVDSKPMRCCRFRSRNGFLLENIDCRLKTPLGDPTRAQIHGYDAIN